MTFEEMCAERDPLYAATPLVSEFSLLKEWDSRAVLLGRTPRSRWFQQKRDQLTREIQYRVNGKNRARRNQGEPYYHV